MKPRKTRANTHFSKTFLAKKIQTTKERKVQEGGSGKGGFHLLVSTLSLCAARLATVLSHIECPL